MKGKLRFLGTGGSLGVPIVGCSCTTCQSESAYNWRLRPSILISRDGKQFLVDAGPDFRQQALRYNIQNLDGILFTHAHYDHTAGVDDLRAIYYKRQAPLPALASVSTASEIKSRFDYIFQTGHAYEKFVPRVDFQLLAGETGDVDFQGLPVHYVTYEQGKMPVNGFCIGSMGYITDICRFSPTIFDQLKGIKTLIISALRFTPSPLHLSIDEAIDFSLQVGAEQVWLTHISHDLDHEKTNAYLPSNIRVAYDGLEIDFD